MSEVDYIKPIQEAYLAVKEELMKVIKGQEEVIDLVLIAFFFFFHV